MISVFEICACASDLFSPLTSFGNKMTAEDCGV